MKTAVVVGNLKPKSRTLDAAVLVATKLTGAPPDTIVDVIELGPALLEYGHAKVTAAIEAVRAAHLLIIASPTYKATYTGVLKLFLDQMPQQALAGIVAVPVMLGAGPAHALAPELTLKPVLSELGAACPMPALYLLEKTYAEDAAMEVWLQRAKHWLPTA